MTHERRGHSARKTRETDVTVTLGLDGTGRSQVATGIGFLDHMLTAFATHGRFDLEVSCRGDLHVDAHHSVEDVGIGVGAALRQALGEKQGIVRFGHAYVPLDEALSRGVVDLSGRPFLHFDVSFPAERVGELPTELVPHFFRSLCDAAGLNLHLQVDGENDHHKVEASFKSVARALRQAIRRDGAELPSTKGVL